MTAVSCTVGVLSGEVDLMRKTLTFPFVLSVLAVLALALLIAPGTGPSRAVHAGRPA